MMDRYFWYLVFVFIIIKECITQSRLLSFGAGILLTLGVVIFFSLL